MSLLDTDMELLHEIFPACELDMEHLYINSISNDTGCLVIAGCTIS